MFDHLLLLDQRGLPTPGAWNMAQDEQLLHYAFEQRAAPVLRLYRWAGPSLSFGCFLKFADALAAAQPGETLIRRWTGGGMVHHGADFAWTLAVPADHAFAKARPAESYVRLHTALAAALTECGIHEASVVPAEAPAPSEGLCFTAPAPGDLLWRGQKIAGAGQRRTRRGLLHQASVQGAGLLFPENMGDALARALSRRITPLPADAVSPGPGPWRYDDPAWLRRR